MNKDESDLVAYLRAEVEKARTALDQNLRSIANDHGPLMISVEPKGAPDEALVSITAPSLDSHVEGATVQEALENLQRALEKSHVGTRTEGVSL